MSLLARPMRDAAYAASLDGWWGVVAGYLGGPQALNTWTPADWARFPHNRKLAIWVGGDDGHTDALTALEALHRLRVPRGSVVVADMETRVSAAFLARFSAPLWHFGYRVWVYGSASTVFLNPALDGYWVADYTGTPHMYRHPKVRATQYEAGPGFDSSLIKRRAVRHLWR